jgi:hypothetical protein
LIANVEQGLRFLVGRTFIPRVRTEEISLEIGHV